MVEELEFDSGYTGRGSLAHIARNVFESDAGTVNPLDGGLAFLASAGERGEAEAAGVEIARLLAGGTSADDIVVTLRRPSVEGPLFASVMREMGIPATLEAHLPLASTAVGRSLLALCRAAADDGEPADVIAHLRADTAFRQSRADWKERDVARGKLGSVAKLMESWGETPPAHLRRVFEARRPGRARPRGRRQRTAHRGGRPPRARRRLRASARRAFRSTRSSSGPASPRQSSWRSSPRSRRFRASTLPTWPMPPTRSSRRPCARGRARPRAGSASSARTGSARDA